MVNHQQLRFLDLQEYQSKQILHENGVKVQKFKVVSKLEDIEHAIHSTSMPSLSTSQSRWSGFQEPLNTKEELVIKAQILAGGRGKGRFKSTTLPGGVLITDNPNLAKDYSQKMLNDYLVTKQTGENGVLVEKVMIAEAVRLKKEFYFAIVLDRSHDGPLLVCSPYGGMDIEEVAAKSDEAIRKFTVPIDFEIDLETARKIVVAAFNLNLNEADIIEQCAMQVINLHKLFLKLDATQIEINPLGVTNKREVICVDAKIAFDENARFRQKWLDELEEMNKSETDKRDFEARKHNLNFIGLDGQIGCLVNGAGLAMATMDIIKLHGGNPANFLDVGGGASATQVTEAFRIISGDKNVQAIFVNIFGGIMRCDVIAEGIIQAAKTLNLKVPIICRLQGTKADEAKKLIEQSKMRIHARDDLEDAAKFAVELCDLK